MGANVDLIQVQLSPLNPPRWVQLISSSLGPYVSSGPSDQNTGTAAINAAVGATYTLRTGPSRNGPWTTEDSAYVVSEPPVGSIANSSFFASNPVSTKYGEAASSAVVLATEVNIQAQLGYDGSSGSFSDTALTNALAALPSTGGSIFQPNGKPKFQTPQTIPAGQSLYIRGESKAISRWRWQGTQQAFITFMGGNEGTVIERMGIMGALADPCVQFLSSQGPGNPAGTQYQALVAIKDSYIGFGIGTGGIAFPTGTDLSYSGLRVASDVFRMHDSDVWGRNYGLKLVAGTTDAYITDTDFSSLPQGGEARGIALWCEDADAANYFAGTLEMLHCNAASGAEAAILGRSLVFLTDCYCESSPLPLKMVTGKLSMKGGKLGTDRTTALHLMTATGSSGEIIGVEFVAPTGANALLDLLNISSSSVTYGWTIIQRPLASVAGTLPATPLVCDAPGFIYWPGVAMKYRNQEAPAFVTPYVPDQTLSSDKRMTLTNNITVNHPTTGLLINGMELVLIWVQDSTGTRTVTYDAFFKTQGRPAMVTTAFSVTVDRFQYDATSTVWRWYAGATGQV